MLRFELAQNPFFPALHVCLFPVSGGPWGPVTRGIKMPDDTTALEGVEFLTEAEVASLLRIGRRSLERWRTTGDGPPWTRAGLRRVLYPRAALLAWAAARTHQHRAAELAARAA